MGGYFSKNHISPTPIQISNYGLNNSEPMFICPGIPFKYSPAYDFIFPKIALEVKTCKFIFFSQHIQWAEILKNRFSKEFASFGLNYQDYVVFLPWLKKEEFYNLMLNADAYLDTIGFSGFNTAIQAIECGLPIITLQGKTLRSSLASGLLKRLSANELIAHSIDEYINLAIRIVNDEEFSLAQKQFLRSSSLILYEDKSSIHHLENIIKNHLTE